MDERLEAYLSGAGDLLKNRRRRASFAMYALGLLSDGERKSMEPIAARASARVSTVVAYHERLVHFIADSKWDDHAVRLYGTRYAIEAMEKVAPISSWIVDDTGFIKQGKFSPGVQRQYTGSAGKVTNCQIAVSLVLANSHSHVAADFDLFIPESWSKDRERCEKAHIPSIVQHRPKWKIALELIDRARESNLPRGVILADAGYGNNAGFRAGLAHLGLEYSVGVHSSLLVSKVGRSGKIGDPISVEKLALRSRKKLRKVTWRQGTNAKLSSRFICQKVVVPDSESQEPFVQMLLIEWPKDEDMPTKYTLSTIKQAHSIKKLVRITKERWHIEESYLELKGELGLDHYEGRSYAGWHHHISVVLCCHAFLVAEHVRSFSPSA